MNKGFFISMLIVGLQMLMACSNSETKQQPEKQLAETVETNVELNAKQTYNWVGTYSGILNCSNCKGIETTIILQADDGYELVQKYLGEKEERMNKMQGKLLWHSNSSSFELPNVQEMPSVWIVGNKKLSAAGANMKAEKIVLNKID